MYGSVKQLGVHDMKSRCISVIGSTILVAAFAASGCGSQGNGDVPANCELEAAPQLDKGEEMEPGGDCIGCHAQDGGPSYSIAGTVMAIEDDDEGCLGLDGVLVEVIGADGKKIRMMTNSVGNFFSSEGIKKPYTAKITQDGQEFAMVTPQTDTNCASCHSSVGKEGAAGRIVAFDPSEGGAGGEGAGGGEAGAGGETGAGGASGSGGETGAGGETGTTQ